MHIGPGTQPPEIAGPHSQSGEYESSPTQVEMLQARETMGAIVNDAVYIRTYAQSGDFSVDGRPIRIAALHAAKRDPRQPHRLDNHTAVRVALVDLATGHVTHDMALEEGLTESSPKIHYFDHDYDQSPDGSDVIRKRPSYRSHSGGPTLEDAALGRFPEFAEIAHTLRTISTQVAHERGDRKWLHDHATGTQKIAYYNRVQRMSYSLGRLVFLASQYIKPKR